MTTNAPGKKTLSIEEYVAWHVRALRESFSSSIELPQTQVLLLEWRDAVVRDFPKLGVDLFDVILRKAFPEHADSIQQTIARMIEYQEWLTDNQRRLDALGALQRQGAIWRKRNQLFGADAELIWAEEHAALAQQQHQVKEALKRLNDADTTSLEEKAYQLSATLEDIYGYGLEQFALDSGVLAQAYFSFDSVQRQLQQLPSDQRQTRIAQLRKQLGFSDEQIAHMAKQDAKREVRWEKGYAYMEARQQLASQLSGAAFNEALAKLQADYFQHEARTIALEEQDGFFRYERPRYFGRN